MWLLFFPAVAFAGFANTMQSLPNYAFSWTADQATSTLSVQVVVTPDQGQSFGWAGFGIAGGGGGMIGGDMFTAYPSGSSCAIQDRMATGKFMPPQDIDQGGFADWVLDSCSFTNNVFTVAAHRPFQTFDQFDLDYVTGPMELLFVWSTTAPTSPNDLVFHNGGYVPLQVSLWGEVIPVFDVSQLPALTDNITYVMPNVSVGFGTNYLCSGFTLTQRNSQPTQAIVFEPVVQAANVPYVHHMVIYTCSSAVSATPFECSSMPQQCSGILYAWGKGGGPLVIPQETGVDIGTQNRSFVALQMHYNNVFNVPSIWDNSGLRIYRTNTLRPSSAGFFLLGTTAINLPSKSPTYGISGACSAAKTLSVLPSQGVTVFASFLHAHQRGRRIWTNVVRNGQVAFQIGDNQNYDFNLQKVQILNPFQQVMPGDTWITYCTYDTSNDTSSVVYGETTQNEMCFNFVMYYPIQGSTPTYNCFSGNPLAASTPGATSCSLVPGEPSAAYQLTGLVQQDTNFWSGGQLSCAPNFKGTAKLTCPGTGAPFNFSGCVRPAGGSSPSSSPNSAATSSLSAAAALLGFAVYF